MSDSNHTPGPWFYWVDKCAQCKRDGVEEYVIDGPPGGHHGQFSHEPDARLIVAAPDMLAALKTAADRISEAKGYTGDGDAHMHLRAAQDAIHAAIAKAEGRS